MTTVDIGAVVTEKSRDLLTRSPICGWAACASVWARVFVLATPGWRRWPHLHASVMEAFTLATHRATTATIPAPPDLPLLTPERFDIEDDGSPEWQHVVDLIAMLTTALDGQNLGQCLQTTLRTYLEGTFNILANIHAVTAGGSISHPEAETLLTHDHEWSKAVEFVQAL